ncbi:MAG: hypothetical protein LBD20_05215 [Spirochaetaceae bacterium]|jgi:4-diphosphocytidyl-2C-methyl-D-erythritol kinase|nr:hypothetical protein [Spirochaetaceae bacterium]
MEQIHNAAAGDVCTIRAPCKINVFLEVGARRPDGFHDINSVFMTAGLYDTVTVGLKHEAGAADGGFACRVTAATEGLPDGLALEAACTGLPLEKNTVFRAAQLFHSRHPVPAVDVRLTKRIPAGAGLGGASTDGAAVLTGLNRLCGLPFSPAALESLSLELGSDVPFFIRAINEAGGDGVFSAQALGRGERLRPAACPFTPPFWVVLVHPGFFSGTNRAYALLDHYRQTHEMQEKTQNQAKLANLGAFLLRKNRAFRSNAACCVSSRPHSASIACARAGSDAAFANNRRYSRQTMTAACSCNSFLPVFLAEGSPEERRLYPALLDGLCDSHAAFYGLTGSGAVCFGIFFDAAAAAAAAANLSKTWAWCFKS